MPIKRRFTIGKRIGLSFLTLIFITSLVFVLTTYTLTQSRRINNEVMEVHVPSVDALKEFNLLVVNSKLGINNWVTQQNQDTDEKKSHIQLINKEYPKEKVIIQNLAQKWTKKDQVKIDSVFKLMDRLLLIHQDIMKQLNAFTSYEDAMIKFMVDPMVQTGGEVDILTNQILSILNEVIVTEQKRAQKASFNMVSSFHLLENVVYISGTILALSGIIIAFLTVRSIVRPVDTLKKILLRMSKGVLPSENKISLRTDEIGEMSSALDEHKDSLERTIKFARNVGSGNFKSEFQPLSENDTLGMALLQMRDDLYTLTYELEEKVKDRTQELVKQKEIVEEKNEQITASITYAERIQRAILPMNDYIKEFMPNSFVLFRPRDIVSGDFYWFHNLKRTGNHLVSEGENHQKGDDDRFMIAAVDCTGHGIPGAFMSMIGINLLNRITSTGESSPEKVLELLNREIQYVLNQKQTHNMDGMDGVLCRIDEKNKILEYAGAKNPFIYVKHGEIHQIKGDKSAIGGYQQAFDTIYNKHEISYADAPITCYIFSDGYQDQFGGDQGRKFMIKRMRNLLFEIHDKPMDEQLDIMNNSLIDWMGTKNHQIDDVLLIGFKLE